MTMFQERFKNFNINFNALNQMLSYSSGDLVTGQVSFEILKETNINSITMSFIGKANVHWTTSGGGSRKRRRRKLHSASQEYFNFSNVICQENNGCPLKLQPGAHVFPFMCQLPLGNFPSSFRGLHGSIVYSMTVSIRRPWHLAKEFVTELNFSSHIDASHNQLMVPLASSNSTTLCCLWCKSGPISLTVHLEKKGFVLGETIRIMGEFSNNSTRTVTPKAVLSQKQTFYTHSRSSRRVYVKHLVSVTGETVTSSNEVSSEMTLPIPSSTSLTISNCSILEVEYVLSVNLSITGSSDLNVIFPIVICDFPVYLGPPPY